MFLLAFELDVPNVDAFLAGLPEGYRIVFSIFNWEQSRAGEGFSTGIDNSGTDLVKAAADAYERMSMPQESWALRRVLDQYARSPSDWEALDKAYDAEPNRYREDWDRVPHLVRALCDDADRLFYVDAEV